MKNQLKVKSGIAISVVAISLLAACSAHGAGLLIADGGFGGVLKIEDQTVNVTINNGVAVTNVEQIFVNTEQRTVEALYTFPVPKKASVANFSMWINGKEMIGEVVEKKRAREIYESYKQTRKDPGLLEQVDFKRFEMRIFPILAGAEQRVRITYYQELDYDHDWANYVYPLATTTRGAAADSVSNSFSFSLDVKSQVPIVEMESPSHRQAMAITPYDDHVYRASLETSSGQLNEDVVVAFRVKRPITGLDTIASKEPGQDGFFQMTLTVGEELETVERGMDYVFVLDVSGSMKNRGKLELSRGSIFSFIENLAPEDRFEIITFNEMPEMRYGQLTPVTEDVQAGARSILNSLQARGGTSLRPAIQAAYRYVDPDRPLNVVVLSDGLTETADADALVETIRSRPDNCRLFAIGIGNDVNRPLLRSIAEKSGGLASFLSQGDNFERQSTAFRRKLTRPAIEDVKLTFNSSIHDVEPIESANIYHGSPRRLYGRYSKGGSVEVRLTGTIMGAPFEKTARIELPEVDDSNPEIERMWASYRVNRLLEDAKHRGDTRAADEIVTLCEQFSIVSEYASFIVLENDAEYQRWNIERRNLARSFRDRAAQRQLKEQLGRLREKALASLGPNDSSDSNGQDANMPGVENVAMQRRDPRPSSSLPTITPQARRGFDIEVGPGGGDGSGGGGALDPITGTLALGLGALGWLQRRKNKK